MVDALIQRGAYVNLYYTEGCCPLFITCQNGYERTLKLLIISGAWIQSCSKEHDSIAQFLLNNGAGVNLYCNYGPRKQSTTLLSSGGNVILCDKTRISPLFAWT